jgi:hypothetical protein
MVASAVVDKGTDSRCASAPTPRKPSVESGSSSSSGAGESGDGSSRTREGSTATAAASVTPEYKAMMDNEKQKGKGKDSHKTHKLVEESMGCTVQEYFDRFLKDEEDEGGGSGEQFTMGDFHTGLGHSELTSTKWYA